uniref:Methyltransf_25 domain-containing protein n=1 Tax=Heterorhabditis bacteriophora TaxID=37862 RepID=A0A1I7XG76_HETBA
MARVFHNYFKLAVNDLAAQLAVPVKSLSGYLLTKRCAAVTDFLNKAVVESLDIGKDDNVLELGYGRGNALKYCLERIQNGNGMVFGIERSSYMEEVTRKRFILEIAETSKLRLDHGIDLCNLPYPTDFISHVFHVDLFYYLHQDKMMNFCSEVLRVLKPKGRVVCGMQFERLRRLSDWGILTDSQWNPMRYMYCLESSGFTDVKTQLFQIDYRRDSRRGEYQLITARKPDVDEVI